jgi:hypothetical protein
MAEDAAGARESERTRGAWLNLAHGSEQGADDEACVSSAVDLHFEHAFGHAVAIGKADLTFGALRHGEQEVIRGRCTRPNAFGLVRVILMHFHTCCILDMLHSNAFSCIQKVRFMLMHSPRDAYVA